MNPKLRLDRESLAAFCRKWRVRELSVFGSALREDFGPDSDVDFLVVFEPDAPVRMAYFLDMKEELEARCGRPVDLVEEDGLRNPWMRHEILRTCEVVYTD